MAVCSPLGVKLRGEHTVSKLGRMSRKIKLELSEEKRRGRFSGYCLCGCGERTELATVTRRYKNGKLYTVENQPKDYIKGHAPNVARGEKSPFFIKGPTRNSNGYMCVYRPNHPRANKGRVYEHIVVMEEYLGRGLLWYGARDPRSEVVHHKNGVRTDNRIENLEVMTQEEHTRLHRLEEAEKYGKRPRGRMIKGYDVTNRTAMLEILYRYEQGERAVDLAAEYGLNRCTIHRYVSGRTKIPLV